MNVVYYVIADARSRRLLKVFQVTGDPGELTKALVFGGRDVIVAVGNTQEEAQTKAEEFSCEKKSEPVPAPVSCASSLTVKPLLPETSLPVSELTSASSAGLLRT